MASEKTTDESTEIKLPASAVYLDEGIVHGHIHNCNNITYIHGHIHHNVQVLPNTLDDSSSTSATVSVDRNDRLTQSNCGITGPSSSSSSLPSEESFNGNGNTNTDLFQHHHQQQQKFRETQHFEFIDYNNASNNKIFATGPLNSPDSLLFELLPRYTPNSTKVPIREPEPYDISLYDTASSAAIKKQKRSNTNFNNNSNSNINLGTATSFRSADSTVLDDCYCNPKLLEICCELPHDNILQTASNNSSGSNSNINNSMHDPKFQGTARSHSAPIVSSPTQTSFLPSFNFTLDPPQVVTDIVVGTDRAVSKNIGMNIIDCNFNCELESDSNGFCDIKNEASVVDNMGTGYEEEDGENDDVFDKFCKICRRLGKSQTDGEICNHGTHSRFSTPLERVSKKEKSSYVSSSRELDMKVLRDLCNISSLYEIPFANHMSHHHLGDSSLHQTATNATTKEATDGSVNNCTDRCTPNNNHNHNNEHNHKHNHHHHHIVELHNHYSTKLGDKRLTNVISRHSTPQNPVVVDRCISYERHSSHDIKQETPGTETSHSRFVSNDPSFNEDQVKMHTNTLNFNWNFKNMILDDGAKFHSPKSTTTTTRKTEATSTDTPSLKTKGTGEAESLSSLSSSSLLHTGMFARVSTPDVGITCQWQDCNQTDFSSLIDLQKHLYRDHISESQANQHSEPPGKEHLEQECRWKGCDFKSGGDICHIVSHINNEHGINFDMKFVDLQSNPHIGTTLPTAKTPEFTPINKEQNLECLWGSCHKKFSTAEQLNAHLETTHLTRGKSHYICHWDNCNKGFTQRQKLVRHLRVHSGFKPFKCSACNRSFSSNETLKQHLRIHSGEKPYECPYCKKRFTVSSTLKVHIRTHTGEKPLECKICRKRFNESSNLNKHMRVHFKQFKCEWCLARFGTLKKLEIHQRSCSAGAGVGAQMVTHPSDASEAAPAVPASASAATGAVVNI